MFIVDYSVDFFQNIQTVKFDCESYIITWVAGSSKLKHFKIKRINKYELGKLYPYTVALNHGRITIEELEEE